MDDKAFETLTRRASMVVLGAAGLAAAFGGPLAGDAKNKAKKKLKKKQLQQCQSQVEQCNAFFTDSCEESSNNPDELQECLDLVLPCCEPLGVCSFNAFYTCVTP